MSNMTPVVVAGVLIGAAALYHFLGSDGETGIETTFPASGSLGMADTAAGTDAPAVAQQGEAQPSAPTDRSSPPAPAGLEGSGATPAAPAQTAPRLAQAPQVDETALRYFARQGDTRRLQAEIARLRALYPDWTPPADPLAVPPQADAKLDSMWQLYSQGKYAELRRAIADRQAAEPAWQPPKDLLDRLAVGEARDRLVNASDLKQYDTVVRVAAETPSLLTCSEVDVLWRVAEAFAMTDRPGRARDAYLYVLRNCTDAAERLATVQKALPLLPRQDLDQLLATEKTGPDGTGEFASVRADLLRESVAAGGQEPPAPVPAGDVTALEALAKKDGKASDALLLGWYYLRSQNAAQAQEWFARARGIEDTAEASQGLGLALIDLGRPGEAEDIVYKWRDQSDDIRKVYLAAATNLLAVEPVVPIDPAVLQRIVPVAVASKDAAAAQQLGWYAHAYAQEETAAEWFATALRWKPDDEPSAYGLAVTKLALHDNAAVAEIQRQWAGRSERIATITEPPIETSALSARQRPPEGRTAAARPAAVDVADRPSADSRAAGNERRRIGCSTTDLDPSLPPGAALARGWCLMDLNRPVEAAIAFERALQGGTNAERRDAAYGQTLAYIRSGLVDRAAVAAAKMPQDRQRSVDLQATILSMRASSFFGKKRFAETLLALDQRARIVPERLDLMALRGYAYLGLRRIGDARQVFEALRNAGDPQGQRGLAAIKAAIEPALQ